MEPIMLSQLGDTLMWVGAYLPADDKMPGVYIGMHGPHCGGNVKRKKVLENFQKLVCDGCFANILGTDVLVPLSIDTYEGLRHWRSKQLGLKGKIRGLILKSIIKGIVFVLKKCWFILKTSFL